jgi:hypothetical protein
MADFKPCPYDNGFLCRFVGSCDVVIEFGVVVRRCSHVKPMVRRGGVL